MKISIVIPVFNEANTIAELLKEVYALKIPGWEKEVIIVNDGSSDTTASLIQNSKFKVKSLKVITHKVNMGKGAAVLSGIKKATGDYILIQDADLEYNPKDIPKLTNEVVKNNAQVVYGTRLKRMPNFKRDERRIRFFIHYIGNKFLSLLTSALYGHWVTDMETGYKLFPRKIIKDMQLFSKGFEFEPEITAKLLKRGYKIVEIPITTNPRGYEKGKKLNTVKDGMKAFAALVKYRILE